MKTKILMTALVFAGIFGTDYAVPEPDPESSFRHSKIVIEGRILSVEIVSEPVMHRTEDTYYEQSGIAVYDVQVVKSLKNPENVKTITVAGYFLREPHPMAYETYPYEVGQKVLLYLQENTHGDGNTDWIIRSSTSKIIGKSFTAQQEFAVAEIQWIPESHSPNGFAAIQVIEPDMNLSPNEIEKFKIHIWSDSYPGGIFPYVYETDKDSGVFVSNIYFSSDPSIGQRLHTLEEDLVIASYEDHTIPTSYDDDKIEILDSMIIHQTFANPNENQDFFRVNDTSFVRQNLHTGETISSAGTFTSVLVGSLGPILIVIFIVIYTVKKRKTRKHPIHETH